MEVATRLGAGSTPEQVMAELLPGKRTLLLRVDASNRSFALTSLSRDVLHYRGCELQGVHGDKYSVEQIGGVFVCTEE